MMTISQRIKFLIDTKGLNKNSFSKRIGVQPQTIHHIVGGRLTNPSFDVLEKIVSTFSDVDATWLITGKGEPLKGSLVPPHEATGQVELCRGCKEKERVISLLEDNLKSRDELVGHLKQSAERLVADNECLRENNQLKQKHIETLEGELDRISGDSS